MTEEVLSGDVFHEIRYIASKQTSSKAQTNSDGGTDHFFIQTVRAFMRTKVVMI
jgi:hypothetical protein